MSRRKAVTLSCGVNVALGKPNHIREKHGDLPALGVQATLPV
jgi:hypothetical protein